VTDRFYVSLSATTDEDHLPTVLDRMQAATPNLLGLGLDGLTLSFTREDESGSITADNVTVLPVAAEQPPTQPTPAQPAGDPLAPAPSQEPLA
jgi:hypothetical protein